MPAVDPVLTTPPAVIDAIDEFWELQEPQVAASAKVNTEAVLVHLGELPPVIAGNAVTVTATVLETPPQGGV